MLPFSRRTFVSFLLAVLSTSLFPVSLRAAPVSTSAWQAFVGKYLEEYFALNPTFAVQQGRHDFDGRFPDWSEAGLRRQVGWLQARRREALAFSEATLSPHEKFERDYLVAAIGGQLFWLVTADSPHQNPFFYADPLDPDVYVSRPYAPLPERLASYLRYAHGVPAALQQIKANLQGPLAPELIAIGKMTIGGLADFYANDVPKVFAPVADPALQKELAAANSEAIAAVKAFSAWLDERAKTATGHFALGKEKFEAMLRETEGVDVSSEQLEAVGRADLERNLAALADACAKFAPGRSVDEAVALASAHKLPGTVVESASRQLAELEQFIRAHDLVTIPGSERAKVEETPAYKRWNAASITIPGPYEHGLPSVYYVSPPDPSWPKQKQLDYLPGAGSLLFTSAHEVWPGHFLQFLHANRTESPVGKVFVGYAFAEGWAHYAEEMMWDTGLGNGDPEMHIGQLTEALLRNARLLAAIGLHTKGMSVADAARLFREQGHTDAASAEEQARRGTFDPAYVNYTMGKLMIRKLRNDWTAPRGGRAAWKQFHDAFLEFGGPPIPLIRKAMLGESDQGSLF
jgi:uncharacterized protein (DUF885 family)